MCRLWIGLSISITVVGKKIILVSCVHGVINISLTQNTKFDLEKEKERLSHFKTKLKNVTVLKNIVTINFDEFSFGRFEKINLESKAWIRNTRKI